MKEIMLNFFTFSGRISRRRYIIDSIKLTIVWAMCSHLLMSVVVFFLEQFFGIVSTDFLNNIGQIIVFTVVVIVYLIQLVASISLGVRRLHDCNISGWWIVMNPIVGIGFAFHEAVNVGAIFRNYPIISIFCLLFYLGVSFLLCFYPGTKEVNKYGAVPVQKNRLIKVAKALLPTYLF